MKLDKRNPLHRWCMVLSGLWVGLAILLRPFMRPRRAGMNRPGFAGGYLLGRERGFKSPRAVLPRRLVGIHDAARSVK